MANINKIRISGTSYDIQDSNATKVVDITQAEYDVLPASAKTANILYNITDAEAVDFSQYWTSAETQSAITEATSGKVSTSDFNTYSGSVDTALNSKASQTDLNTLSGTVATHTSNTTIHVTPEQVASWNAKSDFSGSYNDLTNKLSAGTNITIVDNVISAEGGGKTIKGGRGITVTTGTTADTVSFNLPISAGTGTNSIKENYNNNIASGAYSHVEGSNSTASGERSHAEGYYSTASGSYSHTEGQNCYARKISSHAEGTNTDAKENYSHTEGFYTIANNQSEHASGQYNVSSRASTTFGDSGNTLFSVGNGTSTSARHNAFEIRQNGDIYITSGGTDILLQDHLGGGGSSYTAGDGIDITNDVISVTGMTAESAFTAHTASTVHMTTTEKTNLDSLATNIAAISGITSTKVGNWDTASTNSHTHSNKTVLDGINSTKVSNWDGAATNASNAVTALGGLSLVKLTQQQYDALSTKDSNTLYIING